MSKTHVDQDGQALFSELIALAEEQPPGNQKEATFKIGHRMDLRRFIVPVQVTTTKNKKSQTQTEMHACLAEDVTTSSRAAHFPCILAIF